MICIGLMIMPSMERINRWTCLPDGLGPIGQVAFYGSNISKVIFPKTYGNDTDYPACLWTNTFGGDESLSEIVFQNATPIELFYNEFTEYTFGDIG